MWIFRKLVEWSEFYSMRKTQLEFLKVLIQQDARWLCVQPEGKILLERYEKAVSDDWHKHEYEDIGSLRIRLGWCPHKNKPG